MITNTVNLSLAHWGCWGKIAKYSLKSCGLVMMIEAISYKWRVILCKLSLWLTCLQQSVTFSLWQWVCRSAPSLDDEACQDCVISIRLVIKHLMVTWWCSIESCQHYQLSSRYFSLIIFSSYANTLLMEINDTFEKWNYQKLN